MAKPPKPPKLTLSFDVYTKLSKLIDSARDNDIADQLLEEIERANLVPAAKLPKEVVTMGSKVTFTVESTGKQFTHTLAYPDEMKDKDAAGKLSIFSPVGSAIIGLKKGQSIQWPISQGKMTTIVVDDVLPPESV